MTLYSAVNPYPVILSQAGTGLNGGKVYLGVPGQDPETNPVAVYWDAAGTVPAAQPLTTIGGYIWNAGTPAQVFGPDDYSIRVRDRFNQQVFYADSVNSILAAFIASLLGTAGAGKIGFSHAETYPAGTVGKKDQQQISPLDAPYGAVGDAVADDTTDISDATNAVGVGGGLFLPAGKRFRVTSWSNPLGVGIRGGGQIVSGLGASAYSLATYAKDRGFVFGRENDYAFKNAINTAGVGFSAHLYGDSTVATTGNGGIPGGANTPDVLLADYFRTHGVRNVVTFTNHAVGGTTWANANPVADLGVSTKIMFFKYSINHVSGQDVAAEITAMRSKLAAIRADPNGSWDKVTIVLVGPNSTHDTAGGRTNLWYEQLIGGYQQAAWDFGCVFIDLYGLFPDSRRWASFYSDNPSVHPQDLLRQQLWAYVGAALLPAGGLQLSTGNRWVNLVFDGTTNNWGNYGVGTDPASVSLDEDGWVHMRGAITRASGTATADQVMAKLPNSNYYPTGSKYMSALTYDGSAFSTVPLNIAVDGTISPRNTGAKNNLVALDNISWRVW